MYFVSNVDVSAIEPNAVPESKTSANTAYAPRPGNVSKPITALRPKPRPSVDGTDGPRPTAVPDANNDAGRRVYGRARANLRFSSFHIFSEDFRMQLDYLYSHESETYRKNMLNYMWKHLNARDKHKYYETATKARAMYNLSEHSHTSENDRESSTITTPYRRDNRTGIAYNSSGSKAIGKLVNVKFSESCTAPIITPLRETSIQLQRK